MKRHIKYFVFISVIIFLTAGNLFSQFKIQFSGTTNNLYAVFFADSNTGYAVGDDGVIVKTENSGGNWTVQQLDIDKNLSGVYFINPDTGIIVGEENVLYKTYDGGEKWCKISTPVYADYTAVQFVNDTVGFVTGHSNDGGIFMKTTDGGENWSYRIINEDCSGKHTKPGLNCDDLYFLNLSFLNENRGIIGGFSYNFTTGKHPFICKTTDGGNTFINLSPQSITDNWHSGYEIAALSYITPHDAYAVKNSGRKSSFLYLSDYRVNSFNQMQSDYSHDYHELYFSSFFLDRFIGYFTCLIEGESQILKTIDLGESFLYLYPPTKNTLYSVYFTDPSNGFFVGQNGTILHLIDENNVIQAISDTEESIIEPPFSIAVPNTRSTQMEIFVYNVKIDINSDLDIILYDSYSYEIYIKRSRVKIYSDELRMKIRTHELSS